MRYQYNYYLKFYEIYTKIEKKNQSIRTYFPFQSLAKRNKLKFTSNSLQSHS